MLRLLRLFMSRLRRAFALRFTARALNIICAEPWDHNLPIDRRRSQRVASIFCDGIEYA
jgi:hypothetical protein